MTHEQQTHQVFCDYQANGGNNFDALEDAELELLYDPDEARNELENFEHIERLVQNDLQTSEKIGYNL